jgi:two-component system chemotaxis sensor kinase CheA
VVLFSALDTDEDRRRGSASGATAYLTKSAFDRGHLLDVVNNLVRGAS